MRLIQPLKYWFCCLHERPSDWLQDTPSWRGCDHYWCAEPRGQSSHTVSGDGWVTNMFTQLYSETLKSAQKEQWLFYHDRFLSHSHSTAVSLALCIQHFSSFEKTSADYLVTFQCQHFYFCSGYVRKCTVGMPAPECLISLITLNETADRCVIKIQLLCLYHHK